jgi:hypothetical protein
LATTPTYGWEYQTLADAPNGALLGEDLALDIEATVSGIDTTVTALGTSTDTRLAALELHNVVAARKTANETTVASTVLVNDGHLFVSVEANAVYELYAIIHNNSPAAADIKWGWTFPAGMTGVLSHVGFDVGTSAMFNIGNEALSATPSAGGNAADWALTITGIVIVSSTAGTLQWQRAQNSASGTTTWYAGSHLRLLRLS